MAHVHEVGHDEKAKTERLAALVETLQNECQRLRQGLAKAETERGYYLKALYEIERDAREFEKIDIADLRANSASPVEMIKSLSE